MLGFVSYRLLSATSDNFRNSLPACLYNNRIIHNPYKVLMQLTACFSIGIRLALELPGRNPSIPLFRNWCIGSACGYERAEMCTLDKVRNKI